MSEFLSPGLCPGTQFVGEPPREAYGLRVEKGSPLDALLKRRERQNAKWGEQNHDPITWSAILSEECGEFAESALHDRFGGPAAEGLRDEALDCAAVALQIVECLDRHAAK
jgi:NTP pyrophosphatase (non-canonical NTP hydrolase)